MVSFDMADPARTLLNVFQLTPWQVRQLTQANSAHSSNGLRNRSKLQPRLIQLSFGLGSTPHIPMENSDSRRMWFDSLLLFLQSLLIIQYFIFLLIDNLRSVRVFRPVLYELPLRFC
jgi:hypothetical protein